MRPFTLLFFSLLFASCLFADRFNVGSTELTIPAPEGYVRVTDEMPQLQQFLAAIEDPVNDTFAVYITPEAAEIALSGELPALERYFMLKANKRTLKMVVSVAEFKKVRAALADQQEKGMQDVRKQMPALMEKIEKNLSDQMGIEASLQMDQMVPLGIYMDEPNAVAYSLLMSFGEGEDAWQIVATSTVVNASGKVISLYAYGEVEGLEWTRESSAAWAGEILASNPSAPVSEGRSFDWVRLLAACVGGAALSWFFGLMKHRRRLKGG